MLTVCWSVKGGVGTSVVAAAVAICEAAQAGSCLLVDLAGDQAAVLGVPEPDGAGVADWLGAGPDVPVDALSRLEVAVGRGLSLLPRGRGPLDADRLRVLVGVLAAGRRPVVVDAGVPDGDDDPRWSLVAAADRPVLVLRACYLALRRVRPVAPGTEVVLIDEPGRALGADDVAAVCGVPVTTRIPWDPPVARAVDAGLLARRLPRALRALEPA